MHLIVGWRQAEKIIRNALNAARHGIKMQKHVNKIRLGKLVTNIAQNKFSHHHAAVSGHVQNFVLHG